MATIPASENEFPQVLFTEGAAPGTPGAGLVKAYAKSDGLLYSKDDAGAETALGAGVHVADTTDAHDGSAISVDPTGLSVITGTDVQTALEELDAGIGAGGIPATIVDAKGDLIAATAADTVARLAAGSNGAVLTAQSGQTTGLQWVSLQSARASRTAGNLTYTSSTFADVTGMSHTITTGARRVLITVTAYGSHSQSTFSGSLDINIDGSRLGTTTWGLVRGQSHGNSAIFGLSFTYITDVLSAASHTIKLQAATDGSTFTLIASDPALWFSVQELP